MTIWTDGMRQGPPPTLRELWAADLAHNVASVSFAAEIVAISALAGFFLWLTYRALSARNGQVARLLRLWLRAKEAELRRRGADDSPRGPPANAA